MMWGMLQASVANGYRFLVLRLGGFTLTCSGLQLAKQLDSREDIVRVIVTEVVDCAFGFLPLQVLQERE